eukprot:4952857-Pleurochrysis_carterae.AAC.1
MTTPACVHALNFGTEASTHSVNNRESVYTRAARARLSRAGLRARHEVASEERDGDGVLLDGRRLGVAGELD